MREEWIMHPEKLAPREFKQFEKSFRDYMSKRIGARPAKPTAPKESATLKRDLRRDYAKRLDLLRKHNQGHMPLFDRYMAGEREKVWAELVVSGSGVREDPHAADALAVAYETMRRVNENVKAITAPLRDMGYRFAADPQVPPDKNT
jgi:hypothetical protein